MKPIFALASVFLAASAGCAAGVAAGTGPASSVPGRITGFAEPKIPPACATLVATKREENGFLNPADEAILDTERIQDAIRGCGYGQSVQLKGEGTNNAFVSGPLTMFSGVTLWIDAKTTLFASRNPRDFDNEPGACGTDEFDDSGGCRSLINVDTLEDVGVVGEGTIDGRGGEPMIGGTATWWDVAQHAKQTRSKHSNPRLIEVKKSKNFTLYKVKIFDSPKFHVVIGADRFVVWGITMITPVRPKNSQGRILGPHYARNTDGVDPSAAKNGVIAYNYISVGDDQIAIKGGNAGATEYVTIAHNRFGTGHGMSIGSETNGGVNNILVQDLSIDGTVDSGGMPNVDLNGIRIKSDSSRGGLVERIRYQDVCIRDMVNPILISPYYSHATGNMIPDYRQIVLQNVRAYRTPGSKGPPPVVQLRGYDAEHLLDVTLDNVVVEDQAPVTIKAEFANVTLGPGGSNLLPSGKEVKVIRGQTAVGPPNPCQGKFGNLATPLGNRSPAAQETPIPTASP
jgi:polygalacturonase